MSNAQSICVYYLRFDVYLEIVHPNNNMLKPALTSHSVVHYDLDPSRQKTRSMLTLKRISFHSLFK